MTKKEFNRSVCFTFFEDYRKTAKEIEEDFGKETVADYYNAVIDYALYSIEPELKGVLKYVWHTTKSTIDKSIERRSSGFREDTDLSEKILKYIEENPKATEREIAKAVKCSTGKVNKVKQKYLYPTSTDSTSTSSSNTSTDSTSTSSSNTIREREQREREREREQDSLLSTHEEKEEKKENANAKKEIESSKKLRELEELTDEELGNLLKRYRIKESYTNLQKDFHLAYGTLSKELPSKIDSILKERHKEEIEAKRDEEINRVLTQSAAFSDIDYDERFKMAQANRKKNEEKKKKEDEKKTCNIFKEEKEDWMSMLEQEMDCTF